MNDRNSSRNMGTRLSSSFLALLLMTTMAACDSTENEGTGAGSGTPESTADTAAVEQQDIREKLDLYVSPDGSDQNDGSEAAPFASIDGARDAIRKLHKEDYSGITVNVAAGEYRIGSIELSAADSGTAECPITYRAAGDGEVILNGGIFLDPAGFSKVTDPEMLGRLSDDAKEHVCCIDLTSLGLTSDDWGVIHAIGSFTSASQYDGDYVGVIYCELFQNDRRMNLARYPDTGYIRTGAVVSTGDTSGTVRNPESDVFRLNGQYAKRIETWKTLDDVWMFGYWGADWADASTPVGSFDPAKKQISPMFVSRLGINQDAPFYFFNVFEELDAPGEWYLDRDNGILYLYPTDDIAGSAINLSLTYATLFNAQGVDYLTLDGFTFEGTRGDAISISGSHNTITNCVIKNIAGTAMYVNGYDNLIRSNEITRTGRAGIHVTGGDTETLTPGNNRVDNNYIHDWSEIYLTYQPAVTLNGVGNICSHNEICDSPHEAITYSGNNHIIEYNKISRVCKLSSDAAAIYAGLSWTWYGNVIRYNLIEDLGTDGYIPSGIYWDDGLSGQTAYGNLLLNVPGFSFQIGGGRDHTVYNNLAVNLTGNNVVMWNYDSRSIDGIVNGDWFTAALEGSTLWSDLNDSPWQTDVWKNAFPQMTRFSSDFGDTDNPDFVPNPAYSKFNGNVFFGTHSEEETYAWLSKAAQKYSDLSGNAVYNATEFSADELFVSPGTGDFRIKENSPIREIIPDFEDLPVSEMGRYTTEK